MLKLMSCPKCGSMLSITKGAEAWHMACPNVSLREPAPKYVESSK